MLDLQEFVRSEERLLQSRITPYCPSSYIDVSWQFHHHIRHDVRLQAHWIVWGPILSGNHPVSQHCQHPTWPRDPQGNARLRCWHQIVSRCYARVKHVDGCYCEDKPDTCGRIGVHRCDDLQWIGSKWIKVLKRYTNRRMEIWVGGHNLEQLSQRSKVDTSLRSPDGK